LSEVANGIPKRLDGIRATNIGKKPSSEGTKPDSRIWKGGLGKEDGDKGCLQGNDFAKSRVRWKICQYKNRKLKHANAQEIMEERKRRCFLTGDPR